MLITSIVLLAGCGISQNLTSNVNLNQTNVVLSQKNGSQALINVTVKNTGKFLLFIGKATVYAEGTVIEFDE